jgi:SAM-dependent methyltransferase
MLMGSTSRYQGLSRYVAARWPRFLLGYGGGAVGLVAVAWLSLIKDWYGLILLSQAGLLIVVSACAASLWSAHKLYDGPELRDALLQMGDVQPSDTLLYPYAGASEAVASFALTLTTGRLIAIDIYNPQLMPERHLSRARQQAPKPEADPRISWRDGAIDLLPFPDGSFRFVVLNEVLSNLWQPGDRRKLLAESVRVLIPGGRLLVAEPVRTTTNMLVCGPDLLRLSSREAWDRLLVDAGLEVKDELSLRDLIWCGRYHKPAPGGDYQLPLNLPP